MGSDLALGPCPGGMSPVSGRRNYSLAVIEEDPPTWQDVSYQTQSLNDRHPAAWTTYWSNNVLFRRNAVRDATIRGHSGAQSLCAQSNSVISSPSRAAASASACA